MQSNDKNVPLKRVWLVVWLVMAAGATACWMFIGWPGSQWDPHENVKPFNVLELAVEFDSSDKRFEELVRERPDLLEARFQFDNPFDQPILALCAAMGRTNYVRVLITHGADISEAEQWLTKYGRPEDLRLIKAVSAEMGKSQ